MQLSLLSQSIALRLSKDIAPNFSQRDSATAATGDAALCAYGGFASGSMGEACFR